MWFRKTDCICACLVALSKNLKQEICLPRALLVMRERRWDRKIIPMSTSIFGKSLLRDSVRVVPGSGFQATYHACKGLVSCRLSRESRHLVLRDQTGSGSR